VEKLILLLKLTPYLSCLFWGLFSILEVFVPSLRNSDFNRWEIDEGGGSYINIAGWKKVLTPPRVIARGYMSDNAACTIALNVGIIFVLIAIFGIRHVSGFPAFIPDLFGRF
jgi:hypothetical protein